MNPVSESHKCKFKNGEYHIYRSTVKMIKKDFTVYMKTLMQDNGNDSGDNINHNSLLNRYSPSS